MIVRKNLLSVLVKLIALKKNMNLVIFILNAIPPFPSLTHLPTLPVLFDHDCIED